MNIEYIEESYNALESDSTLQNLIAQANARYILYNTNESPENYPRYTIKDEQLNILAFKYLNIGCNNLKHQNYKRASNSLEKGALILEYIHGSINVETRNKKLFCLISALAYYVCSQYSKSFILISKQQTDTVISLLVSLFLNRNFDQLQCEINKIIINPSYGDEYLAEHFKEDNTIKIYEIVIAKSLSCCLQFYYTGSSVFLEKAKKNLSNLQEIAEIRGEPDIWWVVRLLVLIIEGFKESSLWHVLGNYFNNTNKYPLKYIQSLIYQKNSVTELFITQRNSLSQVLNNKQNGCIVSIPTSSGKTRIAEIAILNCLENDPNAKILFIAPFRSLAYEIESSFYEIFANLDIAVSHLYGGSLFSNLDQKIIDESSVIIATPEKAKALLRSNRDVLSCIKLVVVDEGHLLGANKRLIVNEMFYEELRYHINLNGGKFLLLSAVLPNAEDLSQWLTNSSDNVYKEKWRPSDERTGIMEWDGASVSLKWESNDLELKSFNHNFIIRQELPRKPRQKKNHYFPSNKNQAIAATAYKLKDFGPVLIFVGRKQSVFTIAREYEKCITSEYKVFEFKNKYNWKAFELACKESYGNDSEWLKFAKMGVFCHNADLLADVRLPLERLMRSEKPKVIIATSTLGQGVNLGVSTVIFSTLYQAGKLITKRDFWNIAGRAGRAFVDHEGKILIALDIVNKKKNKIDLERNNIFDYLNKDNLDKAESGFLKLIRGIKHISLKNKISFDTLIGLLAENKMDAICEDAERVNSYLDYIDDSLLSLHNLHSIDSDDFEWIDDYFSKSLAYLQVQCYKDITGSEIISIVKGRIKGIVRKVEEKKGDWNDIVSSGIPINSNLQIDEKLDEIIYIVQDYMRKKGDIEDKINFLKDIENKINDINVLKENATDSSDSDEIRRMWLSGVAMSDILQLHNAISIITNHYSFNLPWVLNGISNKLKHRKLIDESEVLENMAILVELGLPDLKAVKIYQAGIRSRSSACELAYIYKDEFYGRGIKSYKEDMVNNAAHYVKRVTENTVSWIKLLECFSKRNILSIRNITEFELESMHFQTKRLIARAINGEQYLLSLDMSVIHKVNSLGIDFTEVNHINGIYFDYDENKGIWEMVCENPYVKVI